MKASEIITRLIQFDKTENPTFVKLYVRDANGGVVESKRFPVSAVFSHHEGFSEIVIEQSQRVTK